MTDTNSFSMDFDPLRGLSFNAENPVIQPPVLRVYLASPLTNADSETRHDCQIVREVTRHVLADYDYQGIRFQLYDPGEVTPPGSEHSSEEVYVTDHSRTSNADLVIFHVNCPSLGVGMEAQIAAEATLPRVVVSKATADVSRMFLGVFSPTVATIRYSGQIDYQAELSRQLPEIARLTVESAKRRRQFAQEVQGSELGRKIFKQRILQGITIEELARAVDMREFFLRRLERDPALAANLTQIQLCRIVSTINCCVSMSPSGITKLTVSDSNLPTPQRQSLDNLIDFVIASSDWLPDNRLFRVWREYLQEEQEETTEAIRHRSGNKNQMISVEGWRKRYSSLELF
jgi:hypothetical protein